MNNRIWIAISGLAGVAAGATGGYLFARKQLQAKYEELTRTEIDEAKAYYAALYKKGPEFESPEAVIKQRKPTLAGVMAEVNEFKDIIEAQRYGPKDIKVEEPTPKTEKPKLEKTLASQTIAKPIADKIIKQNIFDNPNEIDNPDNWDEEVALRNPDYPYVISFEEFTEGKDGYAQVTLSYFQGDDVLAEPNDAPVDNVDYLIGEGSLDRFGYVSRDPNVVHVRNERINIDYEIIRSMGSYAEEVGGFVPEEQEKTPRSRKRSTRSS